MLRLGVALVLASAMAAGVAAAAPGSGVAKFRGDRVSFTHPIEWKARFAGYRPGYAYLIVALSTEHLHRPVCQYVPQPDGTSRLECDAILESLPSDGVYVTWWEDDGPLQPDSKLTGTPGSPTRIGGRFAKIDIDPTSPRAGEGFCPKATTGAVAAYLTRNVPPGYGGQGHIFMIACTNTADFPQFMDRLLPMLRSFRFRR